MIASFFYIFEIVVFLFDSLELLWLEPFLPVRGSIVQTDTPFVEEVLVEDESSNRTNPSPSNSNPRDDVRTEQSFSIHRPREKARSSRLGRSSSSQYVDSLREGLVQFFVVSFCSILIAFVDILLGCSRFDCNSRNVS